MPVIEVDGLTKRPVSSYTPGRCHRPGANGQLGGAPDTSTLLVIAGYAAGAGCARRAALPLGVTVP